MKCQIERFIRAREGREGRQEGGRERERGREREMRVEENGKDNN